VVIFFDRGGVFAGIFPSARPIYTKYRCAAAFGDIFFYRRNFCKINVLAPIIAIGRLKIY